MEDRGFNGQYCVPKTMEANSKCTFHKHLLFLDLRHAHWLRARLDRHQTLDLQRDALKRAKCRQIFEEHAS